MTGDLRHPTKEESEHIIRETKIMAAILAPAVFGTFTDDTEPMMLAMALTRHITFLLRKYPEHQSRHNAKVIAEMIVQLASLPENPPTMQAG